MKQGLLLHCLLWGAMAVPAAAANSIEVAGAQLELGTAREPALLAMRKQKRYVTTKMPDGRWVVSDREARRPVAVLSFGANDRLVRVEKNWTPTTQSSADFASALFQVVEQAQSAAQSECRLTASQRSVIGPNTAMRDPGKPDLSVRQLDLLCGQRQFHIYINEPTPASLAIKEVFEIPNVLLYESIGRPSAKPANRTPARGSVDSGHRPIAGLPQTPARERAQYRPHNSGVKRSVTAAAVGHAAVSD